MQGLSDFRSPTIDSDLLDFAGNTNGKWNLEKDWKPELTRSILT